MNKVPAEQTELPKVIERFGITLPDEQVVQLDSYRQLLWQWNEKLNLTRHTTLQKFVGRDLVDTLQFAEHLTKGERVLDIGTGGGVPGLPLAICRPDLRVAVCDSTQKKAHAVQAMVDELDLAARVFACRAEELLELETFDTLVARGVAALPKLLSWLAPHWDAFDTLLLIKGPNWVTERGDARHRGLLGPLELRKLAEYQPAGSDAASVVLKLWRPAEFE